MDFGKLLLRIVGIAKDAAQDYIENSQKEARPAQQARDAQNYAAEVVEREKTDAEWNAYFKEILLSEFPTYTIRENVKVTDLAGFANDEFKLYKTRPTQAYKAEWGQPYTFVLKKAGIPVGVLMTGYGSCHSRQVKYLISRMYAKKMGLPYISFYLDMRNRREYVISRIRKFMNA